MFVADVMWRSEISLYYCLGCSPSAGRVQAVRLVGDGRRVPTGQAHNVGSWSSTMAGFGRTLTSHGVFLYEKSSSYEMRVFSSVQGQRYYLA